jgi:hypothetical protein
MEMVKAIQILNNLAVDLEHLKKVEILSPAIQNRSNLEKKLHSDTAERALKTTFLEAKVHLSVQHIYYCAF